MRQLNRILSKSLRIRIKNEIILLDQNPSWDLLQESDDIYWETLDKLRFSGLPLIEEAPFLCVKSGQLTEDWEKQMRTMNAGLETAQINLFQGRDDPKTVKSARNRIRSFRNGISQIQSIIGRAESTTREGTAEQARQDFLLERSLMGYSKLPLEIIKHHWLKALPSTEEVREIARSGEWRILWSMKGGDLFEILPLNPIQLRLAYFSQFYDNIAKSSEPPPQQVIDDDDMLDGWVLWMSKSDEDKERLSPKVARHSEVFIMAEDYNDAQQIFNSNSPQAIEKMRSRQAQLDKRGGLQHSDFQDVRIAANAKRQHPG